MASSCTSVLALGAVAAALLAASVYGQRITTIQLDGTQYFISRMNPYSPELNYFLAYQYCRSIGLQLASFESKEKADAIMQYLINAGYNKYDFWTSGNRLGTDMMIWMSTGLPFNATFDYMRHSDGEEYVPMARQLSAVEPRKDNDTSDGCILLRSPDMYWDKDDCTKIKDFICEQTRCYYYNYGSIPVSPAQGNRIKVTSPAAVSSTPSPTPPTTPSPSPSPTYSPTTSPEPSVETQESEELSEAEAADIESENENENEPTEATHNNDVGEPDTTTETIRSRSSQHRNNDSPEMPAEFPWTWARNIMLEKPVLKKSAQS